MNKNPISRYDYRQTDSLHVLILMYAVGEEAQACSGAHAEVRATGSSCPLSHSEGFGD